MPTLTLHALAPSHPCMTADAALRLKGLEFERVDFPPGPHIEEMAEIYGEGNATVPGLMVDDEPVHGSRAILARLEELAPDPPLFPADRADAVREAERWGDERAPGPGPAAALGARCTSGPRRWAPSAAAGRWTAPGTDFAIKLRPRHLEVPRHHRRAAGRRPGGPAGQARPHRPAGRRRA